MIYKISCFMQKDLWPHFHMWITEYHILLEIKSALYFSYIKLINSPFRQEYLTSDFNTWNKENSVLHPNSYWNIEYNISYKKIYPLISKMKKNTIPYFISKYFSSKSYVWKLKFSYNIPENLYPQFHTRHKGDIMFQEENTIFLWRYRYLHNSLKKTKVQMFLLEV